MKKWAGNGQHAVIKDTLRMRDGQKEGADKRATDRERDKEA